jgi:hypothetical protein
LTKDWNQSSKKYCLPLSIKPISFRIVQLIFGVLLLVPILPWILWQNISGIVLSSFCAVLLVMIEPGICSGSQEVVKIRVDFRGHWYLSLIENLEVEADYLDCWFTGVMIVTKLKSLKGTHILIFWRTRENLESFHRLRLYFL